LFFTGLAAGNAATLGSQARPAAERSSTYRALSPYWLRLLGWPTSTFDGFDIVTDSEKAPSIHLASREYRFVGEGGPSISTAHSRIEVRGFEPSAALVFSVGIPEIGYGIGTTDPAALRRWREIGPGIRVRWTGAQKLRGVSRGLEPYEPLVEAPGPGD
jgi:hypothetical protein